jgi:hypothetical protein
MQFMWTAVMEQGHYLTVYGLALAKRSIARIPYNNFERRILS